MERVLEETRIFANALSGRGVQATGRVDHFDDTMDLTFQTPVARQAESARPLVRSPSSRVRCFNCGRTGHMRSTCPSPRRASHPVPYGDGFGQRTSRLPLSHADAFVCGDPVFAGNGRPPTGRVQTMIDHPEMSHGGIFTMRESSGRSPVCC